MKPKAISLFSGAGGMDIGVTNAGFDNVCSIEMDPHCVATLRRNSSNSLIWQVDVRALDPKRTLDALGLNMGDIALLHGGPPASRSARSGISAGFAIPEASSPLK